MTTLQGKHIPSPKFSNPRAVLSCPRINIANNITNLEKESNRRKLQITNLDTGNGCCEVKKIIEQQNSHPRCEVKKIIEQQNSYPSIWGCLVDHMMQFALVEDSGDIIYNKM